MHRTLLWFKNDLRLDDHPALQAALQADRLLPLYILDSQWLESEQLGCRRLGSHRARFLLESLHALDSQLRNHGSRLLLLQGQPENLLPHLVEQLDIREVLTLDEIAPEEIAQLQRVARALGSVPLRRLPGNSLLQESQLPMPLQQLPTVYSRFREWVEQRLPVFQPTSIPHQLPAMPEAALEWLQPLPTLSQLGYGEAQPVQHSAFPFSGGEVAGQARLRDYLWQSGNVRQYKDTRNGMIGTEYSSKFSPWLANGSLSPRRVAAELRRHEAQFGGNDSTQWLWRELLWREFFRWTLKRHGAALFKPHGIKQEAVAQRALDARFQQWCQGRTGMPLVDACMRELASSGFLSNRGRQIAASYLIHDLQQDWRHGAAWFEEHLLDYDPASNWCNWAYLAGVGNDPRHARVFNTLRQAREYDPEAAYVSLWLPELAQLPQQLRHTPFLLAHGHLRVLGYPCLEQIPESWKPYFPHAA